VNATLGTLDSLLELLTQAGGREVSPCIGDLVANGVVRSRFAPAAPFPSRQDVTQYLAAWCRAAGLGEDACRNWLCGYAVATLRAISRSSPSAIRHSTKSNVKYVYRRPGRFSCARETNPFRASCDRTCPLYAAAGAPLPATADVAPPAAEPPPPERQKPLRSVRRARAGAVKERFREPFMLAVQVLRRERAKGTKPSRILAILQEQDLRTRTGRSWTLSILTKELRRLAAADGAALPPANFRRPAGA